MPRPPSPTSPHADVIEICEKGSDFSIERAISALPDVALPDLPTNSHGHTIFEVLLGRDMKEGELLRIFSELFSKKIAYGHHKKSLLKVDSFTSHLKRNPAFQQIPIVQEFLIKGLFCIEDKHTNSLTWDIIIHWIKPTTKIQHPLPALFFELKNLDALIDFMDHWFKLAIAADDVITLHKYFKDSFAAMVRTDKSAYAHLAALECIISKMAKQVILAKEFQRPKPLPYHMASHDFLLTHPKAGWLPNFFGTASNSIHQKIIANDATAKADIEEQNSELLRAINALRDRLLPFHAAPFCLRPLFVEQEPQLMASLATQSI